MVVVFAPVENPEEVANGREAYGYAPEAASAPWTDALFADHESTPCQTGAKIVSLVQSEVVDHSIAADNLETGIRLP